MLELARSVVCLVDRVAAAVPTAYPTQLRAALELAAKDLLAVLAVAHLATGLGAVVGLVRLAQMEQIR
jgi:hypothetical protein